MKFTRSSFELHTKFIWNSSEFHINWLDFISYEIHKKFTWTSYEAGMKLTINVYVVQANLMWSYGYVVSYGLYMSLQVHRTNVLLSKHSPERHWLHLPDASTVKKSSTQLPSRVIGWRITGLWYLLEQRKTFLSLLNNQWRLLFV